VSERTPSPRKWQMQPPRELKDSGYMVPGCSCMRRRRKTLAQWRREMRPWDPAEHPVLRLQIVLSTTIKPKRRGGRKRRAAKIIITHGCARCGLALQQEIVSDAITAMEQFKSLVNRLELGEIPAGSKAHESLDRKPERHYFLPGLARMLRNSGLLDHEVVRRALEDAGASAVQGPAHVIPSRQDPDAPPISDEEVARVVTKIRCAQTWRQFLAALGI